MSPDDPYIHATELRCAAEGGSRADLGEEAFAERVEYWRHSGLSPEQVAGTFSGGSTERVYDRRTPFREGDILSTDRKKWVMLIRWDDGEEEERDIDSLGRIP